MSKHQAPKSGLPTMKTFYMVTDGASPASPESKAEERIITPDNLLLLTDSYKVSHHVQYPEGTTKIYSYFEPRKGGLHKEICFFGLQYFIKRYLVGQVVTHKKIDEAKDLYKIHFGPGTNVFNEEGWRYIVDKYDGQLPVIIKAVPEGQILPEANACMTVENTDPKCFWLVNFLETLLVQVWYPMTVATNSREQKKILAAYLEETGDPSPGKLQFKLHDFGFRGVSSVESAALGGAAHLTQFVGSDTIAGITMARDYYGEKCAGFSIPASEHSTMTSWGETTEDGLGELAAYDNMLEKYPTGLVAIVSDSYNIWKAVDMYGTQLQQKIKNRNGTLVIRPDSGPPPLMDIELLRKLYKYFGVDENDKGYKELDSHVRVIQGDGIDYHRLQVIVELLKRKGWSINNIAFGSGGGLLQKLNRDTQKCAFKCSYAEVGGREIDVQKRPIHAPGKFSKRGRLMVVEKNGTIVTLTADPDPDDGETAENTQRKDILEIVFLNGHSQKQWTWAEVKKNASLGNFLESDEVNLVREKAETAANAYLATKYASDVIKMQLAQASSNDNDGEYKKDEYEVPFPVRV